MSGENSGLRLDVFAKGLLMGLADLVPGVSSGTIALVTGIYEEMIASINSINPIPLIIGLLKLEKGVFCEYFDKNRVFFLITLGLGMISSFLIGSSFILYALDFYPVFTYSFFFGLILVSAIKILEKIEQKNYIELIFFVIIGSIIAFFVTGLDTLFTSHSLALIFFGGGLAISAMILPGISGSFMLLMIGQYEYMLNALHNFRSKIVDIIVFLVGAVVSLFTFVDLISYLLDNYENRVLSFLTGLMIGALRLPGEKILFASTLYKEIGFEWSQMNLSLTIIFLAIGGGFVYLIES